MAYCQEGGFLHNAPSQRRKRRVSMNKHVLFCLLGVALITPGCSFKRLAVNKLGDALASGGSTFSSEEDIELAKAAAPFSLKLMESLLAETPAHPGLLLAAASGFAQYSYAFIQQDADAKEDEDLAAAEELRQRARRMYRRARQYGLRGLEAKHPGFEKSLPSGRAFQELTAKDVPLLYWTAVSWAGAISLSKDDPHAIAELPVVERIIDRAYQLDEDFGDGAIHAFLITFEMSRQGAPGDPEARSRQHFRRAMELSGAHQAGPLVALAEAVSVQNQNLAEFESLLNRALAINVDARPEWRLANLVMQRRAQWLLARKDQLFLQSTPPEEK